MNACEIRIRFNNGLVMSRRGGAVEISNNISEQSVRKLKMNLRNAGNIGSESSAADNAFMYSVIEGCGTMKLIQESTSVTFSAS